MTTEQINQITTMRRSNKRISEIASAVGVPISTVKSWCRRHPIENSFPCPNCGAMVIQPVGTRQKKFCSNTCRNKWWFKHGAGSSHLKTCAFCGRVFSADRESRKYCSYKCFADAERRAAGHG